MGDVENVSLGTWFPLATEQLRFRGLSHVYLYHPTCQGGPTEDGGSVKPEFYLSFHETALTSPFLATNPTRQQDNKVSWPEIKIPQDQAGIKSTVVRIWFKTKEDSHSLLVIGIHFSGLICIGDNLMMKIVRYLGPNSLIFKLHGHFFVAEYCFREELRVPRLRYIHLPLRLHSSPKSSYGKTSLAKMQRTLRALKQMNIGNERLKSEILARGLDPNCSDINVPVQSTSLRQQIFTKQIKQPATKKKEIFLQKKIEELKLKLHLVRQEKEAIRNTIQAKRTLFEARVTETEKSIEVMTAKFHGLSKDKDRLEEWMKTFDEFRSYKEKAKSDLFTRRKQLISQLREIFPINDANTNLPTVGYVCLPDTENLKERDDTEVSVALGWTAHLTLMISSLLTIPPRYQIHHFGSRSGMIDYVLDKIPDKDRTFPLYPKGVERTRFDYAVYLLNKDIAQLRWHCDETTTDLRTTLRNLDGLLCLLTTREPLLASPVTRLNLPIAPPILSGVATLLSRGTPPGPPACISDQDGGGSSSKDNSSSDPTDTDPDFDPPKVIKEAVSEFSEENTKKVQLENEDPSKTDQSESVILIDSDNNNLVDEAEEAQTDAVAPTRSDSVPASRPPPVGESAAGILVGVSEVGVTQDDEGERNIELGIAADIFWESVTSRAQVLSVPASFKASKQPFRQF